MAYEEKTVGGNGHVAIHDWAPVDENGKQKNSGSIENDIDETRHYMDIIMDTLGNKLHPRSMVDGFFELFQKPENRNKAKETLGNAGHQISQSFQRNPLPAIMVGAGAMWMLWETRDHRGTEGQKQRTDVMKEKTASAFKGAKERAQGTFEATKDTVGAQAEKLQGTVSEQGEAYDQGRSELKEQTRHTYQKAAESTDEFVRRNALAIGSAATALGIFAGMLLPESKKEKSLVGEEARKALEKAEQKGEEIAGKGEEAAKEQISAAEEKAQEEKIPEQTKEQETLPPPRSEQESEKLRWRENENPPSPYNL
jgi:ElaB/YqjD/DUF883 family membrane-anchored ribosome-binding protein